MMSDLKISWKISVANILWGRKTFTFKVCLQVLYSSKTLSISDWPWGIVTLIHNRRKSFSCHLFEVKMWIITSRIHPINQREIQGFWGRITRDPATLYLIRGHNLFRLTSSFLKKAKVNKHLEEKRFQGIALWPRKERSALCVINLTGWRVVSSITKY